MKIFSAVLTLALLSSLAPSAFAGKCQVGASDKIRGGATGIVGGTSLVNLADDTSIQFLSLPSAMYPNYEIATVELSDSILVGSTTRFNECQGQTCKIGMIVTIGADTNGIVGGSKWVGLERGSRVQITDVPAGFLPNYEVAQIEQSQTILVGASTQFKNCQK